MNAKFHNPKPIRTFSGQCIYPNPAGFYMRLKTQRSFGASHSQASDKRKTVNPVTFLVEENE